MAARDLPQELVEEILSFVPVKDLLRFRCVSKSWLNTISSPNFRLSADRTRRRRSVIILEKNVPSQAFLPFLHFIEEGGKEGLPITPRSDFKLATFLTSYINTNTITHDNYSGGVYVFGSYKGLLFLGYEGFIFLLNPSTRQCTKISPHRMYHGPVCVYSGDICYDPSNNDYKFLLAICRLNLTLDVRVISFKEQTCEAVEFPYKSIYHGTTSRAGAVVHEKIHWVVYGRYSRPVLVCFHAANKEFVEVPMPEHPKFDMDIYGLGVLDGCLAMSTYQLCALLLTVEVPLDDDLKLDDPVCCKPLFITSYGEVVLNLGPRKTIAYDLKNHRYREIVLPGQGSFIRRAVDYEESLFFPSSPTTRSL